MSALENVQDQGSHPGETEEASRTVLTRRQLLRAGIALVPLAFMGQAAAFVGQGARPFGEARIVCTQAPWRTLPLEDVDLGELGKMDLVHATPAEQLRLCRLMNTHVQTLLSETSVLRRVLTEQKEGSSAPESLVYFTRPNPNFTLESLSAVTLEDLQRLARSWSLTSHANIRFSDIPRRQISCNPTIKFNEIHSSTRTPWVLHRVIERGSASLKRQEDNLLTELLRHQSGNNKSVHMPYWNKETFFAMAQHVTWRGGSDELHVLAPRRVCLRARNWGTLRLRCKEVIFHEAPDPHQEWPQEAFLWLGNQEIGKWREHQSVSVLPAPDYRRMRCGWMIFEEVQIAVSASADVHKFAWDKVV